MSSALDELNAWVAHPLAWAQPLERPTPRERHLAIRALVEAICVQAISPMLEEPDRLPFPVESALRAAAGQPMADEAWLVLLESLERHAELPEQPSMEGAPLSARLRALLADPMGESTYETLVELASKQAGPQQPAWCWVQEVESSGSAVVRPLVGTAHPSLVRRPTTEGLSAGQLVLWRGDHSTPVPRWLATWDARSRALRVFAGRSPANGRPRYRGWQPDDLTERNQLPSDAPAFLLDLGWDTPAPQPRLTDGLAPPIANPRATQHMAAERVAVPRRTPSTPTPAPADARLILRVLSGRYVLRHAPLERRQPVVIGRNAQFATLVLHHHQISRAHTKVRLDAGGRVWVSDMGSTNGTQVNGVAVEGEVTCHPGDVIGVGPLLLRLEYASPAEEERLTRITSLEPGADRDPLTRLLLPKHLADHLPDSLRPGFRDGGSDPDAPPLWGLLLYIDRLAAIHAQHGEQVADGVFAVASRLLQNASADPMAVVRVGYGEVLVPFVGGEEADARRETQRLIDEISDHPWEAPVRKLSFTAAVGQKLPDEGASDWLARIRRALQQGRSKQGRGQIDQ